MRQVRLLNIKSYNSEVGLSMKSCKETKSKVHKTKSKCWRRTVDRSRVLRQKTFLWLCVHTHDLQTSSVRGPIVGCIFV